MTINTGYIENKCRNGEIRVRIYYDTTYPTPGPDQPLINDPARGFCLEVVNLTGRKATLTFILPSGQSITTGVQQGDPVTTGPTNGRSKTAAEMAALGFLTRGDVTGFDLECPAEA